MEFIIEHYIWFAIGGIILIMTLIGYIADKTQFIEKEKEKEKKKNQDLEMKMKSQKSKEQEQFEMEIDKDKDLMLEESEVYPILSEDEFLEDTDAPITDDSTLKEADLKNGIDFDIPVNEKGDKNKDVKEESDVTEDEETIDKDIWEF